ncbi:MAG: DUF4230 domain-containing protein [Microscillaceae bacterium]|nr:DUF4230 domain-containing protein [Microscillaceae bacterium]MDW8459592.1 DUF4230 domain-containing protein [Cytophagales bacterium]
MKNSILILLFLIVLIVVLLFAYQTLKEDLKQLFLAQPTKVEITHNTVLKEIEAMGKLELVKYKFRDVIEYKVEYSWLPDSKAILIIAGEAVACMDLSKIKEQDIQERGDTLTIQLPSPEICFSKVNHQESKVYDTEYTYFQEAELIDEAYKEAEKQIKNIAVKSDILLQAEKNAIQLLKPLFEQISKKRVFLKIAKPS